MSSKSWQQTELNFTYNFLKSKICKQKRFFFSSVQRNLHFESYQLQKQFGYAFFPRLILNMIKTRPQVISPIHKLRKNGTKFGFDDFWDSLGKQLFVLISQWYPEATTLTNHCIFHLLKGFQKFLNQTACTQSPCNLWSGV